VRVRAEEEPDAAGDATRLAKPVLLVGGQNDRRHAPEPDADLSPAEFSLSAQGLHLEARTPAAELLGRVLRQDVAGRRDPEARPCPPRFPGRSAGGAWRSRCATSPSRGPRSGTH